MRLIWIIIIVPLIPLIIWSGIIQWIWASVVWIWRVFMMPFFDDFTPAMILLLIAAPGIFWGSWIVVKNYFASLKNNVHSAGSLEKLLIYSIISMHTLFLAAMYLSLVIFFLVLIYKPGQHFVVHVIERYQSISFPVIETNFPFGRQQTDQSPSQFVRAYYQDINRGDANAVIWKWKSPKNKRKLRAGVKKSGSTFQIKVIKITTQTRFKASVYTKVCELSRNKRADKMWFGTIELENVRGKWKISKMRLDSRQRPKCQ